MYVPRLNLLCWWVLFLSQVQAPDGGKETWSLLYDLVCHELCQPDDPLIIVQEQKTVLASILSVLSAMFASQTEQEYTKMRKSKLCFFLFSFCLFVWFLKVNCENNFYVYKVKGG